MSEYDDGDGKAMEEVREKKRQQNIRYRATPEGRAKCRLAMTRNDHRKRIKELERRISKEGIKEYKQSIRDKITKVKKKLESIPYAKR